MAAKKPFTFTAISYVVNKSGDGSVRCREEIVFEQVPSSKGTYQFKPIKRTVFMPEEEQVECDKKMMKHAGEVLSDYLSCHRG
ncbi:hypothetical protein [Clostridium sp. KNHs216]|uniref:hypothetical protein n=1 Tax=Clostridium sp. KNHs216 TaxID=1550235 RepID=UPI001152D168|nr:hypothetical protein [Clostridium sp. KNHs216]TQI66754.1 hypothetical protein LY85_1426 [Clostridium sp. KNHs216]